MVTSRALCLLLALAWAAPLSAQAVAAPRSSVITGVVRDGASRRTVGGARLSMVGEAGFVVADSLGRFTLRGAATGSGVIRAQALGYIELLLPVEVAGGPQAIEVTLEPDPIAIAGVDVTTNAGDGAVWGVVLDSLTGAGLPFATAWMREQDRTATADAEGSFRLSGLARNDDLMLVSKLGYTSVYQPVRPSTLGDPLEIRLAPDSAVLKGLAVVTRSMKSRRNAYPRIVRVFTQERIVRSAAPDLESFLRMRASLVVIPCPSGASWAGETCVVGRGGRPARLQVVIDEQDMLGGYQMLVTYPPREIYSVEMFGPSLIHVYTTKYMERIARRPRLLLDP
jgi:hypothetical protein